MYRLADTVTASADAAISGGGTNAGIHLARPTTINVTAGAALAVSANLIDQTAKQTGPAPLTKTGAGNLSLEGVNSYTGATTVIGGVLFKNGSALEPEDTPIPKYQVVLRVSGSETAVMVPATAIWIRPRSAFPL